MNSGLPETDQTFFADRQYLKDGPTNGSVLCRYKDFYSCSNGYVQHQTHCFKVFPNQLTWTAAQSFCRKQGATLAVPHDDDTLKYLSKMAYNKNITNKSFNSFFWIGLQIPDHKTILTADKTPANHFRWLPLGHKRTLADAFKTPHTACALSSSAANTGHVGVFGYNQQMAGSWYSPTQAAGIAFAFAALDLMITILGLAWNGRFFTFDNIAHWFDFAHYYFTISPIDFLGITILRVSLLLGGALGVFSNPRHAAQACSKYSNFCFAFVLLMIAFSPAKLLAFYEHPEARFAVGDWILMIWCILASIFVQGIWISVFSRVREDRYRRLNELNSAYYEGDDADYFAAMQQKEAEEDAQKRETFAMLFRLFGYMAKEWMFYSVAFTFLLLYSLSRVFAPYYTGEVVGAVFGEGASYEKLHEKLFGSLIFMFTLSWRLCMVTLIAVPIIFLVSKVYGVYYDLKIVNSLLQKANDVAEEVLSSIRTVKSFACEKFESLRFLSFLNVTLGIGGRRAIAHIGFLWTTEFLQMGILTVVLFYGGHLVIKGEISSSLLVSFLLYQFQLVAPDGRNAQIEGRIEFRNVHFAYPTRADIPVMNNLSFTVEPGQVVALVGPSGGGKSSCIAALEHFYEPLSGEVLLDGVPIRDYDHKFLHRIIALVGQEPVLYARSVEQNISYGLNDCSKTQIINASRMANSHDFITQTAEGYNTNVGEKGSQMSGVAIARALCSGEAPDPIPVKKPSSATSPPVSSLTTRGRHIRARDSQTTNPGVAQSFLGSSIASSYL
ncbi:ATP-binding cassette sub-family B member 9 [Aphelenchoides besseyi]|nr:ATP-binding cassette sub-family B member 9 [Aphelenchoides besseyi]